MEGIATRTMVSVLVSQGRLREALAMAKGLAASEGADPQLEQLVREIGSRLSASDPFAGLTAEGRARVGARLGRLLARIAARRRGAVVAAPTPAEGRVEPAPVEAAAPAAIVRPHEPAIAPEPPVDESGVALPIIAECDDLSSAVILADVTSGVASTAVSYEEAGAPGCPDAEAAPPPPAPAAEAGPLPSPTELRSRKLRLLEEFSDRIARRKRGM